MHGHQKLSRVLNKMENIPRRRRKISQLCPKRLEAPGKNHNFLEPSFFSLICVLVGFI